MNSNVHPLVVALVLLLTGIAIGTWVWGSGLAAGIGGPAELKTDPDGHAYVQIQDKLVEHDANGQYLKTHSLGDMGLDIFLGGFDFFSNGDILLRLGPDPRSTGDNLRAFQRTTNEQSIEPESPGSGLFRCELDTKSCTRFGQDGVDFKAAHGIFIDRRTDDVYISDTTRHLLRKYSSDGTALSGSVGGFKFPNQLLIFDEKLYVADTNHHEVRVIDPLTESFGKELGRKNVIPEAAVAAWQTWPSHFISVGNGWWVNNMRTGMNQGGIYIFDDNWRFTRTLDLPDDADPIALLAVRDEVWISDWYNNKVRRFSRTGEPLSDLDSSGLNNILSLSRVERRKFEMIGFSGIALFLFVLAGLAVRALAVGMSKNSVVSSRRGRISKTQLSEPMLYLEPDNKALRRTKLAVRLFAFSLIVAAALAVYVAVFLIKPEFGIALVLPGTGMILILVLISWIHRSNVGTAIRVDGDVVMLRDYSGRESSCSLREVRYDDTAIATRDAVVLLGRPLASIYRRKDLKEKLFPRLVDAQKVSPLRMQQILIEQRHPQGVSTILAMIGLLIYGVWAMMK